MKCSFGETNHRTGPSLLISNTCNKHDKFKINLILLTPQKVGRHEILKLPYGNRTDTLKMNLILLKHLLVEDSRDDLKN